MEASLQELVLGLADVGAVKFGSFKLKSGMTSPVYFDLRVTVSFPKLLANISEQLYQTSKHVKYDNTCGVPYTALPFATGMSFQHGVPMLMRRKEAKGYGTNKLIEGEYKPGDICLVVEDVVTSGASVLETVATLKEAGLTVTDAVVLLDREQGGAAMLAAQGITLHSVCTVTSVLEVLVAGGKVNDEVAASVRKFVKDSQVQAVAAPSNPKTLPFGERAKLAPCKVGRDLFEVMQRKKTNLCVAADVNTCAEVLALADKVGPHICVLKTHVDVVDDFAPEFVTKLQELAVKHDFLIFEDRKFADIGNTVKAQYAGGVYKIADWAHITNAHAVPGPGILQGLAEVGVPKGRGCLILAEMSPKGTLATGAYTQAAVEMTAVTPDFAMGFISTSKLSDNPGLVHMTPGVQMQVGGDALGQSYLTPDLVIRQRGSDIIIVGRGIYASDDAAAAAATYRDAAYTAYEARFNA